MIGAVHGGMAIHAGLAEQVRIGAARRQSGAASGGTRVKLRQVALLAKLRRPLAQKGIVDAAMRQMAAAAILAHRRVLPKEWTT